MFLQLPFHFTLNVQRTVLLLNTLILVGILVAAEVVYSEKPREERRKLYYLLPFIVVFMGMLVYAAYNQIGNN